MLRVLVVLVFALVLANSAEVSAQKPSQEAVAPARERPQLRAYSAIEIPVADLRYGDGQLFPDNLSEMPAPCRRRRGAQSWLSPYGRIINTAALEVAGEWSLENYRTERTAVTRQVRFLWFPAFGPAVIVRLTETVGGSWHVVATEIVGSIVRYDLMEDLEHPVRGDARVSRQISRELDAEEADALTHVLDSPPIFDQPAMDCLSGTDGSVWVIEGLDGEAYRYFTQWYPQDGVIHDFGTFSLGLTGWDLGEVY